jgi:hypothetical protein
MEIGKTIVTVTETSSSPALVEEFEGFLHESLSKGRHGDKLIHINISRNTLIAILFSLFIHALILLSVVPHIQFDNAAAPQPRAIEVSLAPPKQPKAIVPKVVEKPAEKPIPKVIKSIPKVMTQKPSRDINPFNVPDVPIPPRHSPETVPPKDNAPTDMASYVKAQQAKRQASDTDAARQNAEAVARETGLSEEQKRDERIKNNFKNGTNGIFEITSLSSRHAAFSFRGWTNDYSNSRRESFEVEASTGQDVRLLMIKKMIALIRQHYQGDFNWESQRLGRVIVQSARPEDSAGLEDFMMMEFFGANYKNSP